MTGVELSRTSRGYGTVHEPTFFGLVDTYALASQINCHVFSAGGALVHACYPKGRPEAFCQTVQQFDAGIQDCHAGHVWGAQQAKALGASYTYFCPYGLVHWAVPVMFAGGVEYCVVAGPVLIHEVDALLTDQAAKRHPQASLRHDSWEALLGELPVVEPRRAAYLAQLLGDLVENALGTSSELSANRVHASAAARIASTIHGAKDEAASGALNGRRQLLHSFEREKELTAKIRTGDLSGARQVVNAMMGFVYFHGYNRFSVTKSKAIEMMVVLARTALEVGTDLDDVFGPDCGLLDQLHQAEDIDELSTWLIRALDRFMEASFALHTAKNRDLMLRAMGFIRRNYHRAMSLDTVAQEVGVNPTYLSRLFRTEVQTTYTDFLHRVRIEASKELLRDGCSLVDASQLSGFSDQSYFSRVFKKVEGISPGKWRERERYQRLQWDSQASQ